MADFVSPEGRMSFPWVFDPYKSDDGKEKFEVTLLLPKDGSGVPEFIAKLKAAVKKAAESKWPDEEKRPKLHNPVKDGDREDSRKEEKGCWVIHPKSNYRPAVVDKSLQEIIDKREVYAGCWGRVSFDLYAYDNKVKGVGFGLSNVMKTRDDTPFGRPKTSAKDEFAAYMAEVDDNDMFE